VTSFNGHAISTNGSAPFVFFFLYDCTVLAAFHRLADNLGRWARNEMRSTPNSVTDKLQKIGASRSRQDIQPALIKFGGVNFDAVFDNA